MKYNDNDVENMTIAEIQKHWVEIEPEDKDSSSKKKTADQNKLHNF